ncbi:acyl-CoA dehydrogenase family protein [Saccharothrix coeruleofusca]|uniref:Hydroxylase n=1 Tax=Saccharothrix coeruleofusca TaxID=33919 RepID=A0A918EF84_9PSEU|nr:acyl-CoA dehydrogenase family protein [Saccharothrix coeruleofusca]GGP63122.1 hydroxylase [Saccharothrix coeruleofusca]
MRALHPLIRAEAADAERDRRITRRVFRALVGAGATRLLAPARLGGAEQDLPTWARTVEDLAQADGSTGWTAMTTSATSALAWRMSDEGAEEVFGEASSVAAGTAAPLGRATEVEGGHRISGRWGWGSAVPLCDWVAGGALTDAGPVVALFPAADVTVHDTWHAAGLRATASHDWEVTDVFVPTRRAARAGEIHLGHPLAAFPFLSFLAVGVAAVGMGIALRAVEEIEKLAVIKTPQHTSQPLAEQAGAQLELARAQARLCAARAFLHAELAERWEQTAAGRAASVPDRARLRLACAHAAREAAEVTRIAFALGGGTAVFETSALQRCLRDAHVAAQHTLVSQRVFQTYGRVRLLGEDSDDRL